MENNTVLNHIEEQKDITDITLPEPPEEVVLDDDQIEERPNAKDILNEVFSVEKYTDDPELAVHKSQIKTSLNWIMNQSASACKLQVTFGNKLEEGDDVGIVDHIVIGDLLIYTTQRTLGNNRAVIYQVHTSVYDSDNNKYIDYPTPFLSSTNSYGHILELMTALLRTDHQRIQKTMSVNEEGNSVLDIEIHGEPYTRAKNALKKARKLSNSSTHGTKEFYLKWVNECPHISKRSRELLLAFLDQFGWECGANKKASSNYDAMLELLGKQVNAILYYNTTPSGSVFVTSIKFKKTANISSDEFDRLYKDIPRNVYFGFTELISMLINKK